MGCEMCGKNSPLVTAMVEGVSMQVCKGCSVYGKVMRPVFVPRKKVKKPEKEVLQLIVGDYNKIVRKARENLNLTQKEFALRLQEKESVVHNIENKDLTPSIALAQKLEKFLRVTLIESVEAEKEKTGKVHSSQGMTIGDMIKLK